MSKGLKLGLAGVGTVGGGLLQLLAAHGASISARAGRPIEVVAVSTLEHRRNPNIDISSFRRVQDPVALAQDPGIDVFIELMGGEGGVAKDSVEAALRAGKHVVTANKALLAHHGSSLAALAEKNGVALNFEAAVAGGIPIVKAIRESLAGNDISRVYGILNGTCNYILTKMEREGRTFADVLKEAQAQGYAEADPTFDIGGFDTAHKLTLLTSLAFGTRTSFESVYIEGIEVDHARRHRGGRRAWLSHQAARRRTQDRKRHRATRAPDHGAEAHGHRRSRRRAELRRRRWRFRRRGRPGRARRRRPRHGVRGYQRPHRHRPRQHPAAFRYHHQGPEALQESADARP